MPETSSDSSTNVDSTRDIIAGWNFSGDQDAFEKAATDGDAHAGSRPPTEHFSWGRLAEETRGRSLASSPGRAIAGSVELLAGFELAGSGGGDASTRAHRGRV